MSEAHRIAEQMYLMVAGEAWHGPALLQTLAGLAANQAAAYPIPGIHSIWEIVNHLAYTQYVLFQRLQGEPLQPTDEEYWPVVTDTSEPAWRLAIAELSEREEQLRQAVANLSQEQLFAPLAAGVDSAYMTFHGHVQHNAYHAGQIRLLRTALAGVVE